MAKQEELLRGLAGEPSAEVVAAALGCGHARVVARAAALAGEGHEAALVAAFRWGLVQPVKRDPGCTAKLAVLEALDFLGCSDPEVFLLAARHVQPEPAWGPPVDTAASLRARGLLGLARMGHADLLLAAAVGLEDPLWPVRQGAAEAVALHGERAGAGLLLLALGREDEDAVLFALLGGLLALAPDWALPRLRERLLRGEALVVDVLVGSARDEAAGLLVAWLEGASLASERGPAIAALAKHRSDRALSALVGLLEGELTEAIAVVEALGARKGERAVRERVQRAVDRRGERELARAFNEAFG